MDIRKAKWILMAVVVLLAVLGVLAWTIVDYWRSPWKWEEYKLGNELIGKIEHFKRENGRLPNDIREVAPEYWGESGPLYFDKKEDGGYIVWFGICSVGGSYTYDSTTQKWY